MTSTPSPSSARRQLLRRCLYAITLLVLIAVLALAVVLWRAPLRAAEFAGRGALRWAGFEQARVAAPVGDVVYFRRGSGPLVVFLHGANDQAGTWARVAPTIATRHRVLVADLAGHGASAPRDGPLVLGDLVDGVRALVEAERKGSRVVLVGNSLGGFLALVHAHRHPDEVAMVVAVNGAIMRGGNSEAARLLLPRTREDARRAMEALTSPRSFRVPDFVLDDLVERTPSSPLMRLLAAPPQEIDRWLLDDRLQDITTPVTLIWGRDDRLIPLNYAEQAAARLPNARLEVIPDCGHMPQRECPAALLPLLEQAIAQAAP